MTYKLKAIDCENFSNHHIANMLYDNDSLEEELRLAASFQKTIMPDSLECDYLKTAIYYQPQNIISGDVYGFSLNREQEAGIFLGDATGHGIIAALMTMMVHIGLDGLPGYLSCDEVLRRMNILIANRHTGRSIASCFMRISPDGTLKVSHAGIPSILVLPKQSNEIVQFDKGGCPLGMFADEPVNYLEEQYQLQSGDKIIAYTDGLAEWRNKDHIPFGEESLLSLFKQLKQYDIEKISRDIVQALEVHANNVTAHDDATLLVFEYL